MPARTTVARPARTTTTTTTTTTGSSGTSTNLPVVGVTLAARRTRLGLVLVDVRGLTLYLFAKDTGPTSTCYGACASIWPPLTTSGNPQAGPGVRAALLGTTRRTNGTMQVIYAGHPLYYYAGDSSPGQTNGEGLNQFGAPWYAVSPSGAAIR